MEGTVAKALRGPYQWSGGAGTRIRRLALSQTSQSDTIPSEDAALYTRRHDGIDLRERGSAASHRRGASSLAARNGYTHFTPTGSADNLASASASSRSTAAPLLNTRMARDLCHDTRDTQATRICDWASASNER